MGGGGGGGGPGCSPASSLPGRRCSRCAAERTTLQALRDKGVRVVNVAAGNVAGTGMATETGKQGELSGRACGSSLPVAATALPPCRRLSVASNLPCMSPPCPAAASQGAVAPEDVAEVRKQCAPPCATPACRHTRCTLHSGTLPAPACCRPSCCPSAAPPTACPRKSCSRRCSPAARERSGVAPCRRRRRPKRRPRRLPHQHASM